MPDQVLLSRHLVADGKSLVRSSGVGQSRFLGRGCDEALFSEKNKGFFSEKGGGNSVNVGFGKDFSTGKAIQ